MAMVCVKGCRECDGCGACEREPEGIGVCEYCGETIYAYETHYDIYGELVHEDCLREWAEEHKKNGGNY